MNPILTKPEPKWDPTKKPRPTLGIYYAGDELLARQHTPPDRSGVEEVLVPKHAMDARAIVTGKGQAEVMVFTTPAELRNLADRVERRATEAAPGDSLTGGEFVLVGPPDVRVTVVADQMKLHYSKRKPRNVRWN